MFLALVVVLDHLQLHVIAPLGFPFISPYVKLGMNAGFAVMFFFAISGFLISYVLSTKYDAGVDGTLAFYKARFIRIFSLYWPMLIILIVLSSETRIAFVVHPWPDVFTHVFIIGVDWRLAFADYPALHCR